MTKSKDIGTWTQTSVVLFLQSHGFPNAENRNLRGVDDAGDIAGCLGVCWEVKGGKAAENASDEQVVKWLAETERERVNAGADIGILVMKRKGIGRVNAGRWWAVMQDEKNRPIRFLLQHIVEHLRENGYGDPL